MGECTIDLSTQSLQVKAKADDESGTGISLLRRGFSYKLKVRVANQIRRLWGRHRRVNRSGTSQPTERADDEGGIYTQHISRIRIHLDEKLKTYVPQMVSLGPLRNPNQSQPEKSEIIKRNLLLNRYGDCHFEEPVSNMIREQLTSRIREWYDECQFRYSDEEVRRIMASYSDEELGRMMAQDGLFLLHFLRDFPSHFAGNISGMSRGPVCNRDGGFLHLEQQFAMQEDVMKIDNQIPIFVLQKILQWELRPYQSTDPNQEQGNLINEREAGTDQDLHSILKHACLYLSPIRYNGGRQDSHVIVGIPWREDSHLLEFVYENIICSSGIRKRNKRKKKKKQDSGITLPSAAQLKEKGVKFDRTKGLLDEIRFDRRKRTLYLPEIEMDGRTDSVLRNLVTYEASRRERKPLMRYVDLMDRLIDRANDVELLRNGRIIQSHLGTDDEVAKIWNGMRQLVDKNSKYEPIDNAVDDVIRFYTSKHITLYAEFKRRYCSKPWIVLSVISACTLLLLTILQTYFAWEELQLQRMGKT